MKVFIHPLTILPTLPSAGIGGLLALMSLHYDFSIIALIGVIMLHGVVKTTAPVIEAHNAHPKMPSTERQ
jgi:multidrug efflux pump subunit AcrB